VAVLPRGSPPGPARAARGGRRVGHGAVGPSMLRPRSLVGVSRGNSAARRSTGTLPRARWSNGEPPFGKGSAGP
jgi:hypothetical protein